MSFRGGGAFSRAIAAVLFLALAAYLAAGLGGRLNRNIRWERVSERSVERFFLAEGIIIRNEIIPEGGQAPEGKRLGAGDSMGEGFFAPASGIYFGSCDGFEHLSEEDIPLLDAEAVSRLCDLEAAPRAEGRLITGNDWYFAFLLPRYMELQKGAALSLDLGSGEIPCLVHSSGEGFAVLSMDTQLELHASLRICEGKIIREKFSGLALPSSAIREAGGEKFVWTVTAGRLEKKKADIIFFGEGFVLVSPGIGADQVREGDKVVTAGEDLYEGKIII
ncbi:MAG: efflux RND transporter periplasmic adaptor subunit [Ruminococcaceae bacterium]|nr:efflux RND transporter periplasmic adaptor subunit [Oscillospiraceae bacterium]